MRQVFIDIGCFDGDTVQQFYNWIDNDREFEIYGFDPNPRYKHQWEDMESHNPKLKFSNKAAWIEDGTAEFTLRPQGRELGSTLMKSKKDWGQGDIIQVETFNFSEWIKQFQGCHIIVKIDAEGAEFEILKKMIADGTDKLVDKFYVEFHPNKVTDYTDEDRKELISKLPQLKEWS